VRNGVPPPGHTVPVAAPPAARRPARCCVTSVCSAAEPGAEHTSSKGKRKKAPGTGNRTRDQTRRQQAVCGKLAQFDSHIAMWKENGTRDWVATASQDCAHLLYGAGARALRDLITSGADQDGVRQKKQRIQDIFRTPTDAFKTIKRNGMKKLLRAMEFVALRKLWQENAPGQVPPHMLKYKGTWADFGEIPTEKVKEKGFFGGQAPNYALLQARTCWNSGETPSVPGDADSSAAPARLRSTRYARFDDIMTLTGGGSEGGDCISMFTVNHCIAALGIALEWHNPGAVRSRLLPLLLSLPLRFPPTLSPSLPLSFSPALPPSLPPSLPSSRFQPNMVCVRRESRRPKL
jgi:hypothetical protein